MGRKKTYAKGYSLDGETMSVSFDVDTVRTRASHSPSRSHCQIVCVCVCQHAGNYSACVEQILHGMSGIHELAKHSALSANREMHAKQCTHADTMIKSPGTVPLGEEGVDLRAVARALASGGKSSKCYASS